MRPGQGAAHRSVSRAAPRHHRATTLDESGSNDRGSLRGGFSWPPPRLIAQQLSTKAAATVEARFAALFDGRPTAAAIAATPDDRLRAVGISPQKLGYIRDLCARTLDKSLALDALDTLADEDVIVALTSVKG